MRRQRIAAVLAVLVLLALAVSLRCLVCEADHDCTGADCPICACWLCAVGCSGHWAWCWFGRFWVFRAALRRIPRRGTRFAAPSRRCVFG